MCNWCAEKQMTKAGQFNGLLFRSMMMACVLAIT
jgi:hypothetical protein